MAAGRRETRSQCVLDCKSLISGTSWRILTSEAVFRPLDTPGHCSVHMPAIRTKRTGSSNTSENEDDEYMPTRSTRRQRGKILPAKARSGHTGSTGASIRRQATASDSSSLSSLSLSEDGERTHAPFTEPITVCGVELRPTVAFDTFWRFAAERKAIDDKRRAGMPPP